MHYQFMLTNTFSTFVQVLHMIIVFSLSLQVPSIKPRIYLISKTFMGIFHMLQKHSDVPQVIVMYINRGLIVSIA